ncbi:MAG: hypothetical protein UY39_C0004G0005 [Candidatus Kaiserbacteria bacterium GW2011_GWC2_49_12]|nr:MAG: hypothetical protein UY39_C0004G0005 [Candidatus Kaiserbacteria bacterium GW2011_GWC2_49_12]
MDYAFEKYPPATFTPPAPESDIAALPPVLRGEWNSNPSEGTHEILYWLDKNNPRGGRAANPASDLQFANWEYPVAVWAGERPIYALPGGLSPGGGSDDFVVLMPFPNISLSGTAAIPVSVAYPDNTGVSRVSYFLNGQEVGSSVTPPFYHSFSTTARGTVTFQVIFETASGLVERTIRFTIQ